MLEKLFKRPLIIVALIAAITVFFALQLPRAELDNNNIRFIPRDDPARLTSDWINNTFGSSTFILVGLERPYGNVFDAAFLQRIKEYCARVEEFEIVDETTSIMNTDYITGNGGTDASGTITVEKLVGDDFTGTPTEIEELRRRITSWEMYEHSLVSDDFSATQIVVPLSIASEDAGKPEVVGKMMECRDIAREMFAGLATVYVTGLPVISGTISESMKSDLVRLIPLVIVVVFVVLFFSFRRMGFVILPLLTVVIACVWSIGAMPLFGVQLTILSTVLPVILVAVGSAYGIHVVTHYQEDCAASNLTPEEHRMVVFALLRKIGKPVFLAALTTFAGFFSFVFTPVLPIREFGIFACVGVISSFVIALTLIPALLILRGPKQKRITHHHTTQDALSQSDLASSFCAIARRPRLVLSVSALVILVSGIGLSRVVIDNAFIEYFRADTDIRRSDEFIRAKFGGSKVVNVVAQAERSDVLLSPASLSAMDGLSRYLQKVPNVGKTMGFTDLVKRVNQVFNVGEDPRGLAKSGEQQTGDSGDAFGFDEIDTFGFDDEPTENTGGGSLPLASRVAEATPYATPSAGGNPPATPPRYSSVEALLAAAASRSFSMSGRDVAREVERLTNYEGAAYYEIPAVPARYGKKDDAELAALVANYLVLLSGDITDYANDPLEPTAIKTTVQLRTVGQIDTNEVIDRINAYIKDKFPATITTTVGGLVMIEDALNGYVVNSQVISIIVSILCVFLIIALSNKSLVAGLVGSLPLSLSLLVNFAVMGFFHIKLNIATALIASVSIGIGVDYTIHFIEAYKREWRAYRGNSPDGGTGDFLSRAFRSSGKAIIINAVSVGAGFAVLLLSEFTVLKEFGLLIALTMLTSSLVSLTVIPVLLLSLKPKFVEKS